MRATYSPEDNKLRIYPPSERLSPEDFATVKAAGYKWAPRQKLFVSPKWTPEREDVALALCGEIGDEDTTLAERSEERAERFDEYSDKRAAEAHSTRDAVEGIAGQIPLGQPILVGHHSAKRARKVAEKIDAGMKKAVKLWETSKYWQDRAAGALAAAKYKELPAVRARRIKTLESELRSIISRYTPANDPPHYIEQSDGRYVWCGPKGRGGCWVKVAQLEPLKAYYVRWVSHYENRIAYEKAMLGESGGLAADRFDIQPGGLVLVRGEWVAVVRVNRKAGKIVSVSTNSRYCMVKGIETVEDYKPPTTEAVAAAKKINTLPPLCNYPRADAIELTSTLYKRIGKDYRATRPVEESERGGRHRLRVATRTAAERFGPLPEGATGYLVYVYLTDTKTTQPPRPLGEQASGPKLPPPTADLATLEKRAAAAAKYHAEAKPDDFDAMRQAIKAGGVKTVAAPQLFPTPPELAAEVVALAGIEPGDKVLEPSAGTGNILRAILAERDPVASHVDATAIEINRELCDGLTAADLALWVHPLERDFLACNDLGEFDKIVMNPPFAGAADIKHVKHAAAMLKPGGRLVAIVANGPRQRAQLEPLASEWRDLPAGSFAESGTNVNAAIVIIDKAA